MIFMNNRLRALVNSSRESNGNKNNVKDRRWQLAQKLIGGEYESLLQDDIGKNCLNSSTSANLDSSLESYIEDSIDSFMKQHAQDDQEFGEFAVLSVAVSCLQLFTQNNWSGPPTSLIPQDLFTGVSTEKWDTLKAGIAHSLSVDGEPCYELAVYPIYLLIARTILLNCRHHLQSCQTSSLWLMRCLQTQQSLLSERSPTLKATVIELINELKMKEPLMTDNRHRNIQLQFHVEAGHLLYYYYEPKASSEHFDTAAKLSTLKVQLTGVMGKRTKYQVKSLAQLMLKVERPADLILPEPDSTTPELPKDCELHDDTVLSDIQIEEDDPALHTPISANEQALVLGLCHQHKKNAESQGDILKEECLAFISKVLSQPQNWCVQSMALLLRTYWESENNRRLERTMEQLEELAKQFTTPSVRPSSRTHLLYCSRWQPKWYVQKALAELELKLGAVKSALDIFLSLEMWDDVIRCYKQIGRTEAAENVIRTQLEKKETPALWCHLGDVLMDPECYVKAWELSDHHYMPAQRSLALYHLRKGQFAESIPCFEKALKINPLQTGAWFSYGCANMAIQDWEKAAKGFRRCVGLETQNFEAWNNLASVYMRSEQKPRAFSAMQEAVKCEYENWRLWENILPLAVDVGEFDEAIRAYHRLIDIKHKYDDADVLAILVKAVNNGVEDATGRSATWLRPRLLELMGRVTATVTSNAEIWRQYALLLTNGPEVTQTDKQRAVQYLQKCHRCLTQSASWEKDIEKCKDITKQSVDIAQTYQRVASEEENITQAVQMLSSCRLMLRGTLAKMKKEHTNPATDTLLPELVTSCTELDEQLTLITDMTARLREAST